jgi:hypothetical protein
MTEHDEKMIAWFTTMADQLDPDKSDTGNAQGIMLLTCDMDDKEVPNCASSILGPASLAAKLVLNAMNTIPEFRQAMMNQILYETVQLACEQRQGKEGVH